MSASQSMDCGIYLDTSETIDQVSRIVAESVRGDSRRVTEIECDVGEFDVRRNEEADRQRSRNSADGFLYFPYRIEFYPRAGATLQDKVAVVSRLLENYRSLGMCAVASCDYEDSLPRPHGGVVTDAPASISADAR